MLQPGDPAPPFSLPDADMDRFHSENLKGKKNLVLYFYPRDDTPGCTLEALEFTDLQPEFEALDAEVEKFVQSILQKWRLWLIKLIWKEQVTI